MNSLNTINMKNLSLIISAGMLLLFFPKKTIQAQTTTSLSTPFIQVTGKGRVLIVPDEILFSYTITNSNEDLKVARSENNMTSLKSINYLKGLGIPDRHIQTQYVAISPVRHNHQAPITGFRATQTINVCIDDLPTYEKIVDAFLDLGVNQINNPSFRSTSLAAKTIEAEELALLNAKEQAERMAKTLGMRVGLPLQIIDQGARQPKSNNNAYGSGSAGSSGNLEESIALGESPIHASVTVVFSLLKE